MKKYLITLLLFLVYFIVTFYLIEYIFKLSTPKKDRYAWQYQELFNPQVKADIVVFGSSKSVRGINPKIMETDSISVYNFGFNGSNPKFTYLWYNSLFKKHYPKPKLIIMEISWMMLDPTRMWRIIEQDSRYLPTKDYFKLLSNTENKEAAFFNHFYIFNRTVGSGGAVDRTYNGYTPNLKIGKSKSTLDSLKFTIDKNQIHYFNLLLETFEKDEVEVLFVILPENLKNNFFENSKINESLKTIKQMCADHNFKVFDYHNFFDNDSLFGDWGHLNTSGADIISKKIKNEINLPPTKLR